MKSGEIKVVPENLDDIWHLYNIIEEGDLVRGVTFRTDEQRDDLKRSKKAGKKRMKLGVRVERVSFHEFSDRLRVHGTIEEGPQELGSYHTLNVDAEKLDTIAIVKEQWKKHQLDRLDEAVKLREQALLVFVSLDEDSAMVAVLRQSGIQVITEIDAKRSGKMYESTDTSHEYYGEILAVVEPVKEQGYPLVIVGPGFAREHLISYGKERKPGLFDRCVTHPTGMPGMHGIQEAIKNGVVDQIIKENRVSFETQLIEQFFAEITKDGLATYGEQEVADALNKGAVKHLLIADSMLRSKKGEQLLALAQTIQSDFTIINTMHDAGQKFEGIGGIGALLRYKL